MTRSEIADWVLGACDKAIAGMEKVKLEDHDRMEAFLTAIETNASRMRATMDAIANGPDDPTDEQVAAVRLLVSQLITVAASACGSLLTIPVSKEDLGTLVVLSQRLD